MAKKIPLSHPGKILDEEFMQPLGISQYRLAKDIGVHPRRINQIVHGKRAITPDTSLRLARYFKMSEKFFLNLQIDYEIRMLKRKFGEKLNAAIKPCARPDMDSRTSL